MYSPDVGRGVSLRNTDWCTASPTRPSISSRLDTTTKIAPTCRRTACIVIKNPRSLTETILHWKRLTLQWIFSDRQLSKFALSQQRAQSIHHNPTQSITFQQNATRDCRQ